MRVVVVGAGIGGLTLAHGLRRAGIDVVVYEQHGEARPQGVTVALAEMGSTALHACLPPEHVAMLEATAGGERKRIALLAEADGAFAVTGEVPGSGPRVPVLTICRRVLRAVLVNGLEDVIHFGRRVERFAQRADGTVAACFADGSHDVADVLVGADGIGSVVRRQYLPEVHIVDNGRRTLTGATPYRAIAATGLEALVGDDLARLHVDGTLAMMLIPMRFQQRPADAGARWLPWLSSPDIADAENYLQWVLFATPEQVGPMGSPLEAWAKARELVAELPPAVRMIIDAATPEATVAIRGGSLEPADPWPTTGVTLLGDAIHAGVGTIGANMAMEDAHRLRDALVAADRGERPLLDAIAGYEAQMRQDRFPALQAAASRSV